MGYIIASKCPSCGYSNKFKFGGGRFNYQTYCPVPAINKETLEFENVNYYEHQESKKYLFYFNEELKGNNVDERTIDNFNFKLNPVNNYCPNCKSKALSFQVTMYFD